MRRSLHHPTWKEIGQAIVYVVFAFVLIFLGACLQECRAQTVVRKGKMFIQQPSEKKIKKDSAVILTQYTYVINDVKYPVYMSSKGSYFIIRTKKDGSGTYRKYVTKEIKQLL